MRAFKSWPSCPRRRASSNRRPSTKLRRHGVLGGFNRSSQHLAKEVAMKRYRRRSDRCVRAALRSGRPPEAQRENCRQFWIAPRARARMLRLTPGCRRRSEYAGSGCHQHISRSRQNLHQRYLSFAEREEIAILRAQDQGVRAIARQLDRPPCTISRPAQCGDPQRRSDYPTTAQWHADRSARRPKPARLATNPARLCARQVSPV